MLALLLYTAGAWALGFGAVRVHSTLNEPLDATLALSSLSRAERDSLSVGVAPPEMFRRFGIQRSALADELRVDARGQPGSSRAVVRLTTRRPVREPFVRFLIEANTSSGKALREYTVLLDPPGRAPLQTGSERAPSASAPVARRSSSAGRTTRAVPRPRERAGSPDRYGPVRRGETLYKIAARIRRAGTTRNQKQVAIFRANPRAFSGNMSRLLQGVMLTIPSAGRIAAIDNRDARSAIRAQRRAAAPPPAPASDAVNDTAHSESAVAAVRGETGEDNAAQPSLATDAALRLEPPSGVYADAARRDSDALFGRLLEPDFDSQSTLAKQPLAKARRVAVAAGVENGPGAEPANAKPGDAGASANPSGPQNAAATGSGAGSPAVATAESARPDTTGDESRPLSAADPDVVGGAGLVFLSPVRLLWILVLMVFGAVLLVWGRRRQYPRVPLDFGDDAWSSAEPAGQPADLAAPDEHREMAAETAQPAAAGSAVAPSVRVQDADPRRDTGLFAPARSTLETGLAAAPDDAALEDGAARTPAHTPRSLDNDAYFRDPEPAPMPPPAGAREYEWQSQAIVSGRERQHDRSDEPGMAFELDTSESVPDRNAPAESDDGRSTGLDEHTNGCLDDRAGGDADPEPVALDRVEIGAPVQENAIQVAPVDEDAAVRQTRIEDTAGHASEPVETNIERAQVDRGQQLPPIDISEFDLEDDSEDANADNESSEQAESVDIRLDLARMYIDMEDAGAARELLEEAIAEGDDAQRGKARALIGGL